MANKNNKKVNCVLFAGEWWHAIQPLCDEDRLLVYDAILGYLFDGKEGIELSKSQTAMAFFNLLLPKLKVERKRVLKDEKESACCDKELFEECWLAYRRKGSKKDSLVYWNKLTDVERQNVLPHIKAYVATRDLQFQKDFQRYLRDKIFQTVVVSGKNVAYDPTRLGNGESANDVYMPSGNFSLTWDDTIKAYLYIGYYMDGSGVPDGYTDGNRPDGATIVLNNGRGTIVWSSKERQWKRTR